MRLKIIKKRIIELSEREIKIIRDLIWEKQERLDYEKDNLDDAEYGVIYHIKKWITPVFVRQIFF